MVSGSGAEGAGKALEAWFKHKISGLEEAAEEAVVQAAERGAVLMRGFISTRGTAKSGKLGRIDSGDMLRAVSSRRTSSAPGRVSAEFGWLDERPFYAKFQEVDELNPSIEGMYAMSDAADIVQNEFGSDLRRRVSGL